MRPSSLSNRGLDRDLLALAAEKTGAAIVITDAQRRIEWINPAFSAITGFTMQDAVGRTPGELLQGPATNEAVIEQMRRALSQERGFDVEILNYHKNGKTYWLHLKVDPVFDAHGALTHFIGIQNDITARVEAQQRIHTLNQRVALAVSGSGFGVWEFDPAEGKLSWDATLHEIYGLTPAAFDGSADVWRRCLHPEDRDLVDSRFQELLAGHPVELFEFRAFRASDGALRYIEANGCPQLDRNGQVVRLMGMNRDATDRKVQRQALKRATNLLEAAAAVTGVGGWEMDIASRELFWTRETYRIHELIPGEYTPTFESAFTFYTPQAAAQLSEALSQAVEHGVPYQLELELLTANGRRRWVQYTCTARQLDGRVATLYGAIKDITQRKRDLDALRASEERLRFVLTATPAVFYTTRATETFSTTFMSENVARLTGYPASAFLENPAFWQSLLHPEDAARMKGRCAEVLACGQVASEYRFLCADGAYRWVRDEVRAVRDARGEPVELVGYWFDIDARRKAEAASRESEARFESLLNSSDAIVWECEPHTFQFTYISAKAERLLGYPRKRWLEPNFWRNHVHADDVEAAASACLASVQACESHRLEYRMIAADGRAVWVEDLVTVIAEQGQPILMRGVLVDISERKALAERLRQAEKIEAIGRLAGGIAHDFNNILAAMTLSIEHLRAGDFTDLGLSPLDELSAVTHRAAELTSQLLTFARRSDLRVQRLEINAMLRSLLKLLKRVIGPAVTICFTAADREQWVDGDASLLEQAFVNLCINARDAMPLGGTLSVKVTGELVSDSATNLADQTTPPYLVRVQVRDTGQGMSHEILQHVFEPFFTTKELGKGTGLGLASVHGTIHQHKGNITVQSEPGQGTCFDVYLPGAPAPSPAAPQLSSPASAPGGTETVLLVDDDPSVRMLTAGMLEKLGYRVLIASDAAQARKVWARHADQVDLLFVDIMMPGGVTGRQLSEALRAERPGLKVLLMTGGRLGAEDGTGAHFSGLEVLSKPFSKMELASALRRTLSSQT